ncbi:MAG: J domain-containing protein [Gemmatimonadetes bacterium]|nr:MAG: J domain-containing protein [Gemmatimonadota bacterium]
MGISNRLFRLAKAYINDFIHPDRYDDDPLKDAFEELEREERKQRRSTSANHSSRRRKDPRIAQYYERLNVPYDSDYETVRDAWKILMKKYHPDRHAGDPEKVKMATKISQDLTEAYKEIEKYLKANRRV